MGLIPKGVDDDAGRERNSCKAKGVSLAIGEKKICKWVSTRTVAVTTEVPGTIRLRAVSDRALIGVTQSPLIDGCSSGPPADIEYLLREGGEGVACEFGSRKEPGCQATCKFIIIIFFLKTHILKLSTPTPSSPPQWR
jgi:hypothetical protein